MPGDWDTIRSNQINYYILSCETTMVSIWCEKGKFDLSKGTRMLELDKDLETALKWYKLHFKLKNFA